MPGKASSSSIARVINANFDKQTAFLSALVKAKSPNPYTPLDSPLHEPIEQEVARLVFAELEEAGLAPQYVGPSKERINVVAVWGDKRARNSLMLNGHMDTVPPGVGDLVSPYSGSVRGGKLYGLGALDMKATLTAYVYATKALKQAGVKLGGKLILAFVVDEESGANSAYGTKYILEQGYVPRMCIIGENGSQNIRIGQRGAYRFKLIVKGEAVHTGISAWERGERGHNAAVDMARAIEALQGVEISYKPSRTFPGRKPMFTFPTKVMGGSALNMVPDLVEAYGDVRLLPGNSDSQIKMLMVERLAKLGISYEIQDVLFVPSVEVDPREEVVETLQNVAGEVTGSKPQLTGAGPSTDGWMLAKRDVPTVFGYGPDGSGVHGRGEWVDLESLRQVTEVYAKTILKLLG